MRVSTGDSLEVRIWEWLPGRTDRSRVTQPATIAAALDVPVVDVSAALARMYEAGTAIRDRSTGVRSTGWHRGRPLPAPPTDPAVQEPTLWD